MNQMKHLDGILVGFAFLSGFSALAYEMTWIRMFLPVVGLSIYSTTLVLATFLGGLGLGSYLSLKLKRWDLRGTLKFYAGVELLIGITALVVPLAIGKFLQIHVWISQFESFTPFLFGIKALFCSIILLPPTILMGLTLPVLIDAASGKPNPRRIGLYYGLNTLGAVAGCALTSFVLIYHLGLTRTNLVAIAINLIIASLAWLCAVRTNSPKSLPIVSTAEKQRTVDYWWLLALFALLGFSSLSYEIIWTRLLVLYLQSSTYSFALILIVFLLGISLGSLIYAVFVGQRPLSFSFLRKLAASLQLALAALGIGSLFVYLHSGNIWELLLKFMGVGGWLSILAQKAVLVSVVIFPTALLVGFTFPILAALLRAKGYSESRSLASVYASNTLGTVLGILVTGLLLLDQLGVQRSLFLVCALNLLAATGLAFGVLRESKLFSWSFATSSAVVLLLLISTPDNLIYKNYENIKIRSCFLKNMHRTSSWSMRQAIKTEFWRITMGGEPAPRNPSSSIQTN